jgi:ribosomal protein S18 acetylase RimI-like enzyme
MQPATPALFEQLIYSRPYFDPAGLIVALFNDIPVGFVHAGFGANDDETAISYDIGTTYQLAIRSDHRDGPLARELLERSEAYLRARGAKVIYAGGIRPLNGFYLGLYGGSELPGILVSDALFHAACQQSGYREIDRVQILQLDVTGFRPPITRNQRQLRREIVCQEIPSPPIRSWWEACTTGAFERIRFLLTRPNSSDPLAEVWFWDIEPLSTGWGRPTAGMFDLYVPSEHRRKGLATFLLSEAFERLRNRGILLIEAQTMQQNEPAIATYKRLGFTQIDEGVVYRKDA